MTALKRTSFMGGLLVALALILPAAAQANAPIYDFTLTTSSTQAGGHPDITTVIRMGNRATQTVPVPSCQCQDPKSIAFHAPTGIIGVPRALPQCDQGDFSLSTCPIDAQVGVAEVGLNAASGDFSPTDPRYDTSTPCGNKIPKQLSCPIAVYNLVPHPGQAGLLGFYAPILGTPVYIAVDARTDSDYGLEFTVEDILHTIPLGASGLTIWGVPADPSNDKLRYGPVGCASQGGKVSCIGYYKSNAPLTPFVSNPTTCGESLTASVDLFSYDHGVDSRTVSYPPTTNCDRLSFNPSLFGQPTTQDTDTASGLEVDLKVPQLQSPSTPSPSEIRGTTVTLPEGVSINPNAADGKEACTDVQAKLGTRLQAECPESAKVGTLEVESDALPGPLSGSVYLRSPAPGDRYRLFLVADGFGLHVKLPGSAHADPDTGRLITSFEDLPQFPFSRFNLHLFGSERGLLATPDRCGTYSVESTFTPWDSALPDQSSHQFFTIDSGPNGSPCPGATRPFDPSFDAGAIDKTAGQHSPFVLEMARNDGDQNLTGLSVTTPPGFTATLKGIPYCPESAIDQLNNSLYTGLAELASSACSSASQVGTAVAGAGAGTHPVYVPGKAYLAGPYKGAPLSLVVVVPALSGPYDLGNVAVRAALNIDPIDAHVTAVSDPMPQIMGGVPLRTRFVRVNLDRKDFSLNPTNCNPSSIDATITGNEGTSASRSTHFQVANCTDLGFAPKLSLKLVGGTKRNGHPAVHATLLANPGDANISTTKVTLPPTEQIDSARIGSVCTNAQFKADSCPDNSILGSATATTPLLDQPLQGTVYLIPSGNALPDIVAALKGQIDFNLHGIVDTAKNGGLRTTFKAVPDVPVTSFKLNLLGAGKGLIVNNTDICANRGKAVALIDGQNGKTADQRVALHPSCAKAKARHKRHHKRHKRATHRARKAA